MSLKDPLKAKTNLPYDPATAVLACAQRTRQPTAQILAQPCSLKFKSQYPENANLHVLYLTLNEDVDHKPY